MDTRKFDKTWTGKRESVDIRWPSDLSTVQSDWTTAKFVNSSREKLKMSNSPPSMGAREMAQLDGLANRGLHLTGPYSIKSLYY